MDMHDSIFQLWYPALCIHVSICRLCPPLLLAMVVVDLIPKAQLIYDCDGSGEVDCSRTECKGKTDAYQFAYMKKRR